MEKYSLADIGALLSNKNDGFLEGNGIIILILFFLIFGFGGGGMWGNNGALTRAELYDGFSFQNVQRGVESIKSGICDGFYAQNTTMLTGFNTIGQEIANNRFAQQNCCCETNRNIDAVRYENARNTCDIVRAIEKDGDATRALINANVTQALRDKIVELMGDLPRIELFAREKTAKAANIFNLNEILSLLNNDTNIYVKKYI